MFFDACGQAKRSIRTENYEMKEERYKRLVELLAQLDDYSLNEFSFVTSSATTQTDYIASRIDQSVLLSTLNSNSDQKYYKKAIVSNVLFHEISENHFPVANDTKNISSTKMRQRRQPARRMRAKKNLERQIENFFERCCSRGCTVEEILVYCH
jgi:hypothetical protein